MWLKLQTVKGCYGYRYNNIEGDRKHAYEMALDLISFEKMRMDGMLTHKFLLIKYRELIDVNVSEGAHRAMKTAVSFE